jgi:hypothetical protein
MNNRCYNANNHAYKDYGGRGIDVCPEWRGPGGYKQFIADLPERPTKRHTLDRIKNELGYSKDNCKWSTREEQGSNKRTTKLLTICGRTQTKSQWARELGLSPTGFNNRVKRGWPEGKLLQKVDRKKLPQLSHRRLMEIAILKLRDAVGNADYEGKEEVESLLEEIGLIPKKSVAQNAL